MLPGLAITTSVTGPANDFIMFEVNLHPDFIAPQSVDLVLADK